MSNNTHETHSYSYSTTDLLKHLQNKPIEIDYKQDNKLATLFATLKMHQAKGKQLDQAILALKEKYPKAENIPSYALMKATELFLDLEKTENDYLEIYDTLSARIRELNLHKKIGSEMLFGYALEVDRLNDKIYIIDSTDLIGAMIRDLRERDCIPEHEFKIMLKALHACIVGEKAASFKHFSSTISGLHAESVQTENFKSRTYLDPENPEGKEILEGLERESDRIISEAAAKANKIH